MATGLEVTTEAGSVYWINITDRLWSKNSVGMSKLWSLKVGTSLTWPHESPEDWEDADEPEIGKHMYIAGRDEWYVSTPITAISVVYF